MEKTVTLECWECGKKNVYSNPFCDTTYRPRWYCPECGARMLKERAEEDELFKIICTNRMFERAIDIIEKNKIDPLQYKKHLDMFKSMAINGATTFDSSHEIAVACEFADKHITADHGFKIGKYRPDFTLHMLKIILEIDGIHHANKVEQDALRDDAMLAIMGPEWEVVHYPDTFVEKHLGQMIVGVKNVAKKQREIRAKYGLAKKNEFTDSLKQTQSRLLKQKTANNPI